MSEISDGIMQGLNDAIRSNKCKHEWELIDYYTIEDSSGKHILKELKCDGCNTRMNEIVDVR